MKPLLFLVLTVTLYLGFFCLPKRLPMTDEGVTVVLSREILLGHAPYGELEWEYTPLAFILHAQWMRLAGPGLLVGRGATLVLAAGTVLFAYAAARVFLAPTGACAAGLAVVLATFPYQCYASYNNYALFFVVASASILLRADPSRRGGLFLAGAVAGLAFLAKQNLGGLALVSGYLAVLLADGLPACLAFGAGGAAALLSFAGFAAWNGFLGGMIDQAIWGGVAHAGRLADSYPLDQIARGRALIERPDLHALDELFHSLSFIGPFLIPLLLLPFAIRARRRGDPLARPGVILAAMSPLAGLGAVHSPSTWHIIFTKPIPILAGACLLAFLARSRAGRALAFAAAAAFFTLHLGRQAMILDDYTAEIRSPLARGIRLRAWESDVINAGLEALASLPAEEKVFVAAADPMYYYLSDRRPPVRWIYLDPPALSPDEVRRVRTALEKAGVRRFLLITGRSTWYDYTKILSPDAGLTERYRKEVGGIRVALLSP